MINVINCGVKQFKQNIEGKRVYVFGAGSTCRLCIDSYLNNECAAIIDNSERLQGTMMNCESKLVPIISCDEFMSDVRKYGCENTVVLISVIFYAGAIIDQLNRIIEIDGIDCYLHFLLRNYVENTELFEFTKGELKIPKKLHYMWLGEKEMPDNLKRYVDNWYKKCPDYEIKLWTERNYDISVNDYMMEAYQSKAWGFVPDYARLDIIYKEGGIYFDTDIELLKRPDALLNDECFMGAGGNDQINLGSGFGAIKGHLLIKDMRDYYNDKHFINEDGSFNRLPCHHFQAPVLKMHGFEIVNKYQKKGNVVIYPASVLSPTGTAGTGNFFTDDTVSIHHTELSWISDDEKKALEYTKGLLESGGMNV